MSYYFNRNKLDNVLARRDRTTLVVNELARRQNISKSKVGKKKKRKPKSKGKHRKKKGVKSTEITIDNQPTQQVRGYSVVNVISAKRGPYKKRDRGLSGQEPIGNFNYRGKKGAFGKGSKYDNSQFTGLVKGSSDDRYRGDPKDKETIRGLRRDVDVLQRRLAQPPQPPQQQPGPAGPPGPPGPPGAPGAPGAPAPARPQPQQQQQRQRAQTPRRQPPPPPTPRNKKVVYKTPPSPLMKGLLIEEAPPSPSAEQKQLAKELKIPVEKVVNMSDMEFMTLLSQLPTKSPAKAPVKEPEAESPPPPPTLGSALAAALGEPFIASQPPQRRGATSGSVSPLVLSGSPRSPPVSVPSTPALNPLGSIGISPTLLAIKGSPKKSPTPSVDSGVAKNQKRYGNFNPPPPQQFTKRKRTGKGKKAYLTQEWYDAYNNKISIGNKLRGIIPDNFYVKQSKPLRLKTNYSDMIKWSKDNLDEGGQQFISDTIRDVKSAISLENTLDKRDKAKSLEEASVSGGSAGGEIYNIPENPVLQLEDEEPEGESP